MPACSKFRLALTIWLVHSDPALKRIVCKGCNAALVPGLTSTVRVKRAFLDEHARSPADVTYGYGLTRFRTFGTASKAQAHVLVYTCTGCHARRRIPATPHTQEEALPAAPGIDHTAQLEADAQSSSSKTLTKRERREKRQARPPVFFERNDHVVVRGSAVLSRDEYRRLSE